MTPVCELCKPTFKKLRDDIARLKTELAQKSKLVLDFSTLATAQCKKIAVLEASELEAMSRLPGDDDTTIPWSSSIVLGRREVSPGPTTTDPAARPKVYSSSTPRAPVHRWAVAGGKKASSSSSVRHKPQGLQLKNTFSILLDEKEFPPLHRRSSAHQRPSSKHLQLQNAVERNTRASSDAATPQSRSERSAPAPSQTPSQGELPSAVAGLGLGPSGCIPPQHRIERPLEAAVGTNGSDRHGVSSSHVSTPTMSDGS